jgi:hypothetical protein
MDRGMDKEMDGLSVAMVFFEYKKNGSSNADSRTNTLDKCILNTKNETQ